MSKSGLLVVIEGTDGSGKGTQHTLLYNRLKKEGIHVETVDFPRYDQASSYFVTEYLNGRFGTKEDITPKQTSLFYALDRYAAKAHIHDSLHKGAIVLANRFTSSNMAFQGAKLAHKKERARLFKWIDNLEHTILDIPRPDLIFVLQIEPDIAQTNVDKKQARNYTTKKRDIHEADLQFLKRTIMIYGELCQLFPQQYIPINCMATTSQMKTTDEIHNLIWQTLASKL